MTQSLGAFANLVATAGSLMGCAAAVGMSWRKRSKWEPVEEDLPNSSLHVGALLAAVTIGVLWYLVSISHTVHDQDLIKYMIWFAVATIFGLIAYCLLLAIYIYEKAIAISKKSTRSIKIIGGFWLTDVAKESLASGNPRPQSVQDLISGSASLDQIWPRSSRAFAKLAFVLAYICFTVNGTCLLACAALLVSLSMGPSGH